MDRDGIDSTLAVETPEGIAYTIYPAGIAIRACAWAIDWFLQGILILAILITAGIMSWALGTWFTFILIFAINWFYHTIFEILWKGQSLGKKIIGIRVVRGDGSPVNPGASFLRNLMRFADTFMFLYLISFIMLLASRSYRRIGDWTADTLVVYSNPASGRLSSPYLRQSSMPWLAEIPVEAPPRKLSYEEKQAILSFARRYPLFGKARADELAQVWVDKLEPRQTEQASAYLLGLARSVGGSL